MQGVGFRFATLQQANEWSLAGHVRNLDDGRVEVIACGSEAAVAGLESWLHEGPPLARVREVTAEDVALRDLPADFTIR